jgi:serine phosphatase RsbU (regulator of sigma subunit)
MQGKKDGNMARRPSKTTKFAGTSRKRLLTWSHLVRALAWLLCGVLIIYLLILNSRQAYFSLFETLVLIALLFAMLNTSLADPAVLLNRSLVYSVFAICLAVIYLGGTAVLLLFLEPGWPRAFLGVFTLGVIVLMRPLRTRIQASIDKRFYRRQYEAARTIDTFTATLREEIDRDQLSKHLIAVVQQAVQSQTVSLWVSYLNPEGSSASVLERWKQNNRGTRAVPRSEIFTSISEENDGTTPLMDIGEMNIPYDDPIVSYALETPGVVEIERLRLDSPVLRHLRVSQMKLALPLVSQGELIGWLSLGARRDMQEYTHYERRLLTTLSNQVAPALRVAQMVHEQQMQVRAGERIEQELRTARFIQQALLPREVPTLPGWHIVPYYQPAREVGGDFYDFLPFEDGRLGIILGDVTDKGVPAALVMATTCTMLRTASQDMTSPCEVLARVNDLLYARIPSGMFVTCFYAQLDPTSGRLIYANAGQDLPYCRSSAGVSELWATGMPLGMMPGTSYEEREVIVLPGDRILFYSDGLVEAHNPEREMFSLPRLRKLIEERSDEATLIDFLLNELRSFTGDGWEQEDDVTLVELQRAPDRKQHKNVYKKCCGL